MIINCNGVKEPSKQAAFLATLDVYKPDIVLGCESKLCNSMCSYEFFPKNYTIFRKDRNINGGGVFVATSDRIISYEIPDMNTVCEIIWAGLHFSGSKPLYLASFYKPPNTTSQPLEALASSYNKLITLHKRSSPHIIIGGDFNLPGIDWETLQTGCTNKAKHEVLLDFLLDNSLSQLISQATRPTSNNILDLLITSSPNLAKNIQAAPGISDHLAIIFDANLKPHIPNKPSRKVYQFHKADKISLKMKAKAVLDKCIKSDPTKNDINTNWCTIKGILNNLLNDYTHYRTTKSRHNLPWITNEIKHNMRKRDRLFHRAMESNSNTDWSNFRKSAAKSIISSLKNYINNIIGMFLVISSTFKKPDNIGAPTLKTGTKVCNSDIDKVEALNNHIHNVISIPKGKINLFDGVSSFESIPTLSNDACCVLPQLRRLNPNKAHGPDELSPQLSKLVAEELAPALTIIFQQSYDPSCTPKDRNSAIVTPIYKKDLKSYPSNYRSISLTCICCNIMEHIMPSHIAKHIAKNNIIINEQHGFGNKLSTITQLINTTTDWANTLNNKGQTDIIIPDLSKAFDKISQIYLIQASLLWY